jgi:uncharacterized repeat protein (TIGR03803 family)
MTNAQGNRGWAAAMRAAILMMLAATVAPAQQGLTVLVNFDLTNGDNPYAGLAQGLDGNFYGTAYSGALNLGGAVFKVTPTGTLSTLYSFCAQTACSDGSGPLAGLVLARDGSFYGTTFGGGAYGNGTVFKITSSGALTTLHSFCAQTNCTDGSGPYGGLVQGIDGNFYGTTAVGGTNIFDGTVFKVTPAGALTTLHSFSGGDGSEPNVGLAPAADGSLYGTTYYGGSQNAGTVFRISSMGTLTTLHNFCSRANCADGQLPDSVLIQATDGNFYGTTQSGGSNGYGTVFRITPSGTLKTLHSFDGLDDGGDPSAGLLQATDGDLYGTTAQGGVKGYGTIFKIGLTGSLTTLDNFDGGNGYYSTAALTQSTSGTFYGTTSLGGNAGGCSNGGHGCGTIFSLDVGLGPFVETLPAAGKAGNAVKIVGTDLTGASSVTFNGVPATFKVLSPSAISAAVPTGTATGPVQVVTPSGTLTSNVNFRVLP